MAEKITYKGLCGSSNASLDGILRAGALPSFEAIAGWEFRGFNTPLFAKLIGIQKFVKGFFYKKSGEARLPYGYNIPVRQNGPDAPWIEKPSDDAPKRFGFYEVRPAKGETKDNKHPNCLLLDYGAPGANGPLAPPRVLRDYLVQPDPQNPDIYLGKAYLAIGGLRIFSNFFILERHRKSGFEG